MPREWLVLVSHQEGDTRERLRVAAFVDRSQLLPDDRKVTAVVHRPRRDFDALLVVEKANRFP